MDELKKQDSVNCRKCKHFFITWDTSLPNGCKMYGIKSKQTPSLLVKQNSGYHCLGFEEKIAKKDQKNYGD